MKKILAAALLLTALPILGSCACEPNINTSSSSSSSSSSMSTTTSTSTSTSTSEGGSLPPTTDSGSISLGSDIITRKFTF